MTQAVAKSKPTHLGNQSSRMGGANYRKFKAALDSHETTGANGLRKISPIKNLDVVPNKISNHRPEPIMVRPSDLWVDGSYQRDIGAASLHLITSIVGEFAWHKFKPPVLTKDSKGRLVVIDGQHTAIAASMHPDIDKIPAVLVTTNTAEEQAESFIGLNTNRISVHPIDLFRAHLAAGNEQLVEMKRIIDEAGIEIPATTSWVGTMDDRKNKTQAINTLKGSFTKLGPAKFAVLLEKLAKCEFEPIRAEHIKAFTEIMFYCTSPKYSHDHLVETVSALDDKDMILEASRTASHLSTPKWRALAIVYKNYYRKAFNQIDEAA